MRLELVLEDRLGNHLHSNSSASYQNKPKGCNLRI